MAMQVAKAAAEAEEDDAAFMDVEAAIAASLGTKCAWRGPRGEEAPEVWRGQRWRPEGGRYGERGGRKVAARKAKAAETCLPPHSWWPSFNEQQSWPWGAQEQSWGPQGQSWGAQEQSWGAQEQSWGSEEQPWDSEEQQAWQDEAINQALLGGSSSSASAPAQQWRQVLQHQQTQWQQVQHEQMQWQMQQQQQMQGQQVQEQYTQQPQTAQEQYTQQQPVVHHAMPQPQTAQQEQYTQQPQTAQQEQYTQQQQTAQQEQYTQQQPLVHHAMTAQEQHNLASQQQHQQSTFDVYYL